MITFDMRKSSTLSFLSSERKTNCPLDSAMSSAICSGPPHLQHTLHKSMSMKRSTTFRIGSARASQQSLILFARSNLPKFYTHHLKSIGDQRNSASPPLPPVSKIRCWRFACKPWRSLSSRSRKARRSRTVSIWVQGMGEVQRWQRPGTGDRRAVQLRRRQLLRARIWRVLRGIQRQVASAAEAACMTIVSSSQEGGAMAVI
jgi:hypothetical protein